MVESKLIVKDARAHSLTHTRVHTRLLSTFVCVRVGVCLGVCARAHANECAQARVRVSNSLSVLYYVPMFLCKIVLLCLFVRVFFRVCESV